MDSIISEVLKKIEKIPTIPVSINRIIAVINNSKSSAEDVNRAVSSDVSLAAKVLKLVNSPYYGLSAKVSSITQAIVILGFNTILSLALSASVLDLFKERENTKFKRAAFLDHCLAVGLVSKLIGKNLKVNPKEQETFFLAGILHDVGKIVLDNYFTSDFDSVLEILQVEDTSIFEAEKRILGTTHSEIGKLVLKRWKIPEEIIDGVRFHHAPFNSTNYQFLATVIYLADFLCKAKRIGYSGEYYIKNFKEEYLKNININTELIKRMLDSEIDYEMKKAACMFNIIKNT